MGTVAQVRKGYKIVNYRPRYLKMVIPEDWQFLTIDEIFRTTSGGTPPRSNPDLYKGNIPWIKTGELNDGYLGNTEECISEEALRHSAAKKLPPNTVLFAMYGATIGKTCITTIEATTNQACCAFIPRRKNLIDPYFFQQYLILQRPLLTSLGEGAGQPNTSQDFLQSFQIPLPSYEEQVRISSILLAVDSLIRKTEEIIEQTQRLKKGLMQQLLTRGINHTRFKTVNIGKKFLNVTIPDSWCVKKFGDVLKVRETFIDLDDSADYTRVTVRRKHEGVVVRDIVKGKGILTKNQYRVYRGDFIVSRRQIIHDACGLVPKELDGAVVSNEYSCFTGTEYLDLDYMDWFSRTKLFQQTITVTTHGVADEKYVFLLEEWLKLLIPLPPIEEQKKIVKILSTLENLLAKHKDYLQDLNIIKKGLMQKLLTGKIRVKV